MFDELLDMFDRDGGRNNNDPNQPKRKGFRGFLDRLRSMGDDDDDDRRNDRRREYDDEDNYAATSGRRRERDRDFADFD